VPTAPIATDAASAGLFFSAHDLFDVVAPIRGDSQNEGIDRKAPATFTANELAYLSGPRSLAFPTPVQALVGPWLPKLTNSDPTVVSTYKATGHMEPSPWQAEKKAPISRMDQVWRVAPARTLARTYDGMTIDGDVDLGLEVHAGSAKKDRATNALKGTVSTQVTLLPDSFLEQRFGRYLGMMGKNEESGQTSTGQMRMVLATNGAYDLNPSTRAIKPTGAIVGTLSWMTPTQDRFTPDPWQVVAFRWQPSVSCEGRSLVGDEKKKAEANRLPVATLTGNLRGDLRLDFLSPWLAASGNYHYGQGLTDGQAQWEQTTFSWKYQLNSQVSLGGSFTHDKGASKQQTERGLKLEMGVTF